MGGIDPSKSETVLATEALRQQAALTISVMSAVEVIFKFLYFGKLPWDFRGTRSSA